jgi:hypothetical protein
MGNQGENDSKTLHNWGGLEVNSLLKNPTPSAKRTTLHV